MKNIFLVLFLVGGSILLAQKATEPGSFSSSEFGVYGGMNFNTPSYIHGSAYFEGKTNVTSNINLKLSIGYYRAYSFKQYTVNAYKYVNIEDYKKYHAVTYNVSKTKYDVIPISAGAQFVFVRSILTPYIFCDFSYNLIDPLPYKTPESLRGVYDSVDQIPDNFKNPDILPNGSYGIAVGVGTTYRLFSSLSFDIRYLYKYDSEIINTHQLLIGIVF